jgi:hypothetical protein
MDGGHLLALYAGIAELTRQMLAAARADEWETTIALGQACSVHLARLAASEDNLPRDAGYQHAKGELIRSALDNDAEIRLLVEPLQAQLLALIGHNGQRRRLHDTYVTGA